jgi:hypothetical protein
MRTRSFFQSVPGAVGAIALICTLAPAPAFAQGASGGTSSPPDLTGLWDGAPGGPGTRDLNAYMKSLGQEIPFTPYGAERYKNVDFSKNPNGFCLPPGPSRALTGPSPFLIVQHPEIVAILFENHNIYRPIYLDGRPHPEEMKEYPFFMGHSVGRWEGNTLVVDTVGINDRTWLDSYGLEHSDQLHIVERFEVLNPDLLKYSVTYEDPVFFTKPWTVSLNMERLKDTRILEYVCMDNEKDQENLVPTTRDEFQ